MVISMRNDDGETIVVGTMIAMSWDTVKLLVRMYDCVQILDITQPGKRL